MIIGLLAFQGAFKDHIRHLEGHETKQITAPAHLHGLDGLIIPGGESSVMMKFLEDTGTGDALLSFAASGKTVMGICAGACVLAGEWKGEGCGLGLLDISIERNHMGSHRESGWHKVDYRGLPGIITGEEIFIRAPRLICGKRPCSILATKGEDPVLIQHRKIIAASFHPELKDNHPLYRHFLHTLKQ